MNQINVVTIGKLIAAYLLLRCESQVSKGIAGMVQCVRRHDFARNR